MQTWRVEDEFESPFAHVPSPAAGPAPLQDGPFTYERLVNSTGRANLTHAPLSRSIVLRIAIAVVLGGIAVGIGALVLSRLVG